MKKNFKRLMAVAVVLALVLIGTYSVLGPEDPPTSGTIFTSIMH